MLSGILFLFVYFMQVDKPTIKQMIHGLNKKKERKKKKKKKKTSTNKLKQKQETKKEKKKQQTLIAFTL